MVAPPCGEECAMQQQLLYLQLFLQTNSGSTDSSPVNMR